MTAFLWAYLVKSEIKLPKTIQFSHAQHLVVTNQITELNVPLLCLQYSTV